MSNDIIITNLTDAFQVLRDAIKTTADGGLENDKALLTLCEALAVRVSELDDNYHTMAQNMVIMNDKLNILHELYHTHFADNATDDGEETKH